VEGEAPTREVRPMGLLRYNDQVRKHHTTEDEQGQDDESRGEGLVAQPVVEQEQPSPCDKYPPRAVCAKCRRKTWTGSMGRPWATSSKHSYSARKAASTSHTAKVLSNRRDRTRNLERGMGPGMPGREITGGIPSGHGICIRNAAKGS
jgi:hypothetical protein